ncbi:hypothetical protein [Streptomyces sp. SID5614]|uniref:hypothetical protein n=1 Tax=Streptomyces sp. SID5614 TaxID=2690306 RepID=UPI00136A3E99|nr:hypothetical protein [Streptomyces sp. SID5614]MZG03526.1 hypothetical protein [Streptomyces sp. SID5614]
MALRDESIKKEIIDYANGCHLYLIGHRPMTVVDPDSLSVDGTYMTARFISYEKSDDAIIECFWKQPGVTGGVRVETDWPHNVLRVIDASGNQIARGNASLFLAYAMVNMDSDEGRLPVDAQFLDLQVDYVGKAYGSEGERGALTRLQSHKTFQRILAELPRDSEAWIILLNSDTQTLLTTIVPWGKPGDAADIADNKHIERALSGPLTDEMIVDFTEGCLIKYFQPRYNIQLKNTFPHPSSKPLGELYARDLNAVGFELDTRHLGVRLRSEVIDPSFHHGETYSLHSAEDRRDMFDFIDDIDLLRARPE